VIDDCGWGQIAVAYGLGALHAWLVTLTLMRWQRDRALERYRAFLERRVAGGAA
jgi:hypothetical protein